MQSDIIHHIQSAIDVPDPLILQATTDVAGRQSAKGGALRERVHQIGDELQMISTRMIVIENERGIVIVIANEKGSASAHRDVETVLAHTVLVGQDLTQDHRAKEASHRNGVHAVPIENVVQEVVQNRSMTEDNLNTTKNVAKIGLEKNIAESIERTEKDPLVTILTIRAVIGVAVIEVVHVVVAVEMVVINLTFPAASIVVICKDHQCNNNLSMISMDIQSVQDLPITTIMSLIMASRRALMECPTEYHQLVIIHHRKHSKEWHQIHQAQAGTVHYLYFF